MPSHIDVEQLESRELPSRGFRTLPILPFFDAAVLDNARAIVARGRELGRNVDFVLKLGDSNSSTGGLAPESFLSPLGSGTYNPNTSGLSANSSALVSTWAAYHSGPDSLLYEGPGAYPGLTSADVLAAYGSQVAATNAGIAFIMIGTNDMHTGVPLNVYTAHLRQLVRGLTSQGVLPVLSTIPDSHLNGGSYHKLDQQFNQAIADVAHEFSIPLWNTYVAFNSLPNQGLLADGVHLSTSPNGGGSVWPADMPFAQNVRNLECLLKILRWFREKVVAGGPTQVPPQQGWRALPATENLYAVGRDQGVTPTVDVYDAGTGKRLNRFVAFRKSFGGGVRVAIGDVNGDGFTDVICATGPGTPAAVRVFSGVDGSILGGVRPFGNSYVGGLNVAVGDLDGDGTAEVVVGSGAGTGVRVYTDGNLSLVTSFQAFAGSWFHGVDVAVANVKGAGPEIAAAAANTGGVVRLFTPAGSFLSVRHPYGGSVSFGLSVTAADLNADGFDELAIAPSSAVKPVHILDPNTKGVLANIDPGPAFDGAYGLRLGTIRTLGQRTDTLLVGNGPGVGVEVEGFNNLRGAPINLPPRQDKHAYGIFVG